MRAAACIRIMVDMRPIRAIRILSFLTGVVVASLAYAEPRLSLAPAGPAVVANPPHPAAPIDVVARRWCSAEIKRDRDDRHHGQRSYSPKIHGYLLIQR